MHVCAPASRGQYRGWREDKPTSNLGRHTAAPVMRNAWILRVSRSAISTLSDAGHAGYAYSVRTLLPLRTAISVLHGHGT